MAGVLPTIIQLRIGGREARLPAWLPRKGWSLSKKGYACYKSNRKNPPVRPHSRAHRNVIIKLLSEMDPPREIDLDWVVHHMDFNKLNCCPCNLLYLPGYFNPTGALRDPYTGEYMSAAAYQRRYMS